MLHSFGLGFFFLISISPFTCETPCPRANYLPLSVYSLLLCEFSCVRCISTACVTLSTGEVRDWQVRVWESSPSESFTWISFRAGPQGGLGFRGERAGTLCGNLRAFSTERPALSGHLWEVEGSGWWVREVEWSPCPRWGDEQVSKVIMRKGELFLSPALHSHVQSSFLTLISSGKCAPVFLSAFVYVAVISCVLFGLRIMLSKMTAGVHRY